MNELEKAQAVVTDKNNSFAKLKKGSGVPIPTLKAYRADPEKLRTAKWITVHKLASMYEKQEEQKMKTKIENQLYDALLKWVEVADSTPSDPEQGVVLTYQADDGTLSFYEDFYLSDFEDFEGVEIKDGGEEFPGNQLFHNGEIVEDLEECEQILGYDTIAKALLNDVKSDADYNEENAKNFIEYLEK